MEHVKATSGEKGDATSIQGAQGQTVRKRAVFYIPGYDPFPPRRYRELYRKESAAQAQISSYDVSISPQAVCYENAYSWNVNSTIDECDVQTQFHVLSWSDLVRKTMGLGVIATYGQLIKTAWIYISTGALFQVMKTRKGPVIAALYPVGMLLLQLFLAICLGLSMMHILKGVLWPNLTDLALPRLVLVLFMLISGAVIWSVLKWFERKDHAFFVYYLMHDFAHSAQYKGQISHPLQSRMALFSDYILDALQSDVDEVLVVGHSSGAHLGVSILAQVLCSQAYEQRPSLSFLSLGHVVPMVSFLPHAQKLRGDLAYLSEHDALTWIDVTAPGDGCAFALCDPVHVSGVATRNKRWPIVISAAFTQSLSPKRWAQLRWRFFRLHFQYLCAFDRPKDYDYFQITAGPHTLAKRYHGRVASKSRIETPLSSYTSQVHMDLKR